MRDKQAKKTDQILHYKQSLIKYIKEYLVYLRIECVVLLHGYHED